MSISSSRRSRLRIISRRPQPSCTPSTCSWRPAGSSESSGNSSGQVRLLEQPASDPTEALRLLVASRWRRIQADHQELLARDPYLAVVLQLTVETWLHWLRELRPLLVALFLPAGLM
jgi:hypothetical protein